MDAPVAVRYFEFADLLPGVKHFHCSGTRASLSVDACARNWREANTRSACPGSAVQGLDECGKSRIACKGCSLGALHAGADRSNLHPLHGTRTCARCLNKATRLICKHLCVSCYNRQREALQGRNRKGTAPERLTVDMLEAHSVTYRAGDELRTRTIDLATGRREVIVAVLRDEHDGVEFVDETDRAYADLLCAADRSMAMMFAPTVHERMQAARSGASIGLT